MGVVDIFVLKTRNKVGLLPCVNSRDDGVDAQLSKYRTLPECRHRLLGSFAG
jgi:hypothetical protein